MGWGNYPLSSRRGGGEGEELWEGRLEMGGEQHLEFKLKKIIERDTENVEIAFILPCSVLSQNDEIKHQTSLLLFFTGKPHV